MTDSDSEAYFQGPGCGGGQRRVWPAEFLVLEKNLWATISRTRDLYAKLKSIQ